MIACATGLVIVVSTGCNNRQSAVVNAVDTYQRACARCHGTNGSGVVPANPQEPTPRDFTDGAWQASMTDEGLLRVVRDGKGSMPSFGDALTESEMAAAVASVRSFGR